VGSTDWPAYKHGKLFFTSHPGQVPRHRKGAFCGFHIEKGLSRRVASFYPKELIGGKDWAWERFTASIKAGFPALPPSQFVSVAVSYIPTETVRYDDSPESFIAQKDSFETSKADFAIDAQQHLELCEVKVNENCAEIAKYFEAKICAAANLDMLLDDLQGFPQSDWSWVDLYIGTVVDNGPIAKLWNDCLKPWSVWLETGLPASQPIGNRSGKGYASVSLRPAKSDWAKIGITDRLHLEVVNGLVSAR
jgi:hypothetical protein